MASVITQVDIAKYYGMDKAVFPIGTIVTPSAKDWAREHNLKIVIGECSETDQENAKTCINYNEKEALLQQVIKSIVNNMDKADSLLSKDKLVKVVTSCLQKLGCQVDD